MSDPKNTAQRRLATIAACLAIVALCIVFVDRAVSTWSHGHLHGMPYFDPLTHIVDPLHSGPAWCLVLVGIAVCAGWRPRDAGMTLVAICLSLITAYAVKEAIKYACGRTWPETWVANNPSWIKDGSFGFHPFHGKEGWASFPSGHTTLIATFATVWWHRVRPLRWLGVGLTILVAVGLVGADYHFVGDIMAGAFLGIACASGVLAILFRVPAP